jgi:hypothetical protein
MSQYRIRSQALVAGVRAILAHIEEIGCWNVSPSTAELDHWSVWGDDYRRGWEAAKRMSDAELDRYLRDAPAGGASR